MKFVSVYIPGLGIRQMTPLAFKLLAKTYSEDRKVWRKCPKLITGQRETRDRRNRLGAERAWAKINAHLEFRFGREG